MPVVLVVDDVPAMAEQYAYDLERLGTYQTIVAHDGRRALDVLEREAVDCVLLDLEMPGVDGFEVLRALGKKGSDVPVIVYTGTGNFDRCVEAVKLGAYGFIDKAESMERVVREIQNAIERRTLVSEVHALRRRLDPENALVGSSRAMDRLREAIARVAPIPSPVLIVGESGSGKELVARELHRLGPGAKTPFVAINSAALPEHLVESELFGHERGAFTGAATLRKGAFEAASGGTLFLDEIGELPSQIQAKLLRVLEQRQVTRLGGNRVVGVESRVVAATNRDLEREVAEGRFRPDLYYRVSVHVVRVPPLRERLEDVPELVTHLLDGICERFGVRRKSIDPEALQQLARYDWRRNNVRELRNVVERLVIAADGETIGVEHVPPEVGERRGERGEEGVDDGKGGGEPRAPSAVPGGAVEGGEDAGSTFRALKAEAERRILLDALTRNDWHITKTAHELGLADHASLLKIMRRHGITRPTPC